MLEKLIVFGFLILGLIGLALHVANYAGFLPS